jgi:hypothetical protein
MIAFLTSIKCKEATTPRNTFVPLEEPKLFTMAEYNSCKVIQWNDMEFTNVDSNAPELSILTPMFIAKLKEQINKYMPIETLKDLDAFNHLHFPDSVKALQTEYPSIKIQNDLIYSFKFNEIDRLSKTFGWDPSKTKVEYVQFIETLLKSQSWSDYKGVKDHALFWAMVLADNKIVIPTNLLKAINTVIAIPSGSIAPETGYSLFNIIKTRHRSTISDKNLESILIILINGPQKLSEFNAYDYAKIWKNSGHYTPDDTRPFPPPKKRKHCDFQTGDVSDTDTSSIADATEANIIHEDELGELHIIDPETVEEITNEKEQNTVEIEFQSKNRRYFRSAFL